MYLMTDCIKGLDYNKDVWCKNTELPGYLVMKKYGDNVRFFDIILTCVSQTDNLIIDSIYRYHYTSFTLMHHIKTILG